MQSFVKLKQIFRLCSIDGVTCTNVHGGMTSHFHIIATIDICQLTERKLICLM